MYRHLQGLADRAWACDADTNPQGMRRSPLGHFGDTSSLVVTVPARPSVRARLLSPAVPLVEGCDRSSSARRAAIPRSALAASSAEASTQAPASIKEESAHSAAALRQPCGSGSAEPGYLNPGFRSVRVSIKYGIGENDEVGRFQVQYVVFLQSMRSRRAENGQSGKGGVAR